MTRTLDRTADIFTVGKLGRTQEVTPEGFLLCRDVPIARIGEMTYGHGETPVRVGRDLIARVSRGPEVLLSPQTLSSFEGKAITMDHPPEDVSPSNWRKYSVGTTHNVRAGVGDQEGMMLADLLVMDAEAIAEVRDGLREVSNGYDADYEDLGEGLGRQTRIIGNHVALVRFGRCGPVCSIGDSEMKTRDKSQKTQDHKTWMDKMKGYFLTRDEENFVKELEGAPDVAGIDGDDKTHNITINLQGAAPEPSISDIPDPAAVVAPADPMAAIMTALSAISARLDKLEGGGPSAEDALDTDGDGDPDDVDEDDDDDGVPDDIEDDDVTKDAARKAGTRDAKALSDEFADTVARAEILSPGVRLPTFDAKSDPKKTLDSICALRRRALARVADEHKETIRPLLSGLDLNKATCDSVRAAFLGASELARRTNDASLTRIVRPVRDSSGKGVPSIADINKRNREVWATKRA